ncbi:hypothetical protein SRABI76_02236 [Microbacterium oxydans]|uniref:hypothetical protein n=1 Tax=Microbacterium oxydans TaxID=82380 RepID=UPI001E09950F|nr:hypothetical protein [Microbacterium oxydans]CAH0209955.1 hypothetical protein SRABI76_02236 [Microbacterium oxydans]
MRIAVGGDEFLLNCEPWSAGSDRAITLALVGLVFLATRLELWGHVGAAIDDLGAVGLALWGLVVTAALAGVSFLAFRRAIP